MTVESEPYLAMPYSILLHYTHILGCKAVDTPDDTAGAKQWKTVLHCGHSSGGAKSNRAK